MKWIIALIAAVFLLPACSEEPGPVTASARSSGDCFRADNASSFTPRGTESVDVRVSARRQYRLRLAGYCPDVDWSQQLALRTRSGSAWICRGMDAEIIVPDRAIGLQRCLVSDVRRLSEAEIEAERRR